MAMFHTDRTHCSYSTCRKLLAAVSDFRQRCSRFRRIPIAFLVAASAALSLVPTAFASAGPNSGVIGPQHASTTQQDSTWLQAKLQYRVYSGIKKDQGKGAHTHPVVLSTPFFDPSKQNMNARLTPYSEFPPVSGAPSSFQLSVSSLQYTAEPSGGSYTNFPGVWNTADDYSHPYSDQYYYSLCGPGASDVALFYWPAPPNYANYIHVSDPMLSPAPYSSWNGQDIDGTYRMRGYMLHIAYTIKAPTWHSSGMLPQSYYQSGQKGGVTLQVISDALNWEASNENTSTWGSYFYVTQWNSAYYNQNSNIYPSNLYTALHNDIVTDLAFSHVPVIVEVTAGYLPNWTNGSTVNHAIAIVGYDDNTGKYTYIDTCKAYTNCNGGGYDTPDAHPIDQMQLSEAVANIGTNMTTGDGGWVW